MTLRDLLFDAIQMQDKQTLRILIENLGNYNVFEKLVTLRNSFDTEPFSTRFDKMRNYVIFLNRLNNIKELS